MSRTRVVIATAICFGVACTPNLSSPQTQAPVIVIGSQLPVTGPVSESVTPLRDAIDLAIADHPSVRGYALRYESLDDSLAGLFSPLKGEQNAKILSRDPRVLGVVGPYNSRVAQFAIPVTNAAGLAVISPSNTLDCLTAQSPCVAQPLVHAGSYFRLAGSDSSQGRAAADFAVRKLTVTRFAVLNDGTDFGAKLANSFASALTALGGTVVLSKAYSRTQDDYRPLLREAAEAGADSVFAGGLFELPCKIRAQMPGIFPPNAYLITGDQVTSPACAAFEGKRTDDHLLAIVSSSQPPATNPVFKEFMTHHIRPVTYTFEAYDAAAILIKAIENAIESNGGRIPSRGEVVAAVGRTHDFSGTSGTFTFSPSGDPVQPSVGVYRMNDGDWIFWQAAT